VSSVLKTELIQPLVPVKTDTSMMDLLLDVNNVLPDVPLVTLVTLVSPVPPEELETPVLVQPEKLKSVPSLCKEPP
jgi:hypothetical protein